MWQTSFKLWDLSKNALKPMNFQVLHLLDFFQKSSGNLSGCFYRICIMCQMFWEIRLQFVGDWGESCGVLHPHKRKFNGMALKRRVCWKCECEEGVRIIPHILEDTLAIELPATKTDNLLSLGISTFDLASNLLDIGMAVPYKVKNSQFLCIYQVLWLVAR